jgi:trehalose-6-phosphatase
MPPRFVLPQDDHTHGDVLRLGVGYHSGEYGSFCREPGKTDWMDLTYGLNFDWKKSVLEIFDYYAERTPGSFIEHKSASLVWHFRLAEPQFG